MKRAAAAAFLVLAAAGCGEGPPPETTPNVLWIVWDTVRADHLSLYGYSEPTTPFLDEWAQGGLVFDDCRSVASSTVPTHGSMFTGLFPSEHGANNNTRYLDEGFDTIAELFRDSGYATYLYSANPNIQFRENFHQGFQVEEHPWDPERREEALAILRQKVEGDEATGFSHVVRKELVDDVHLKACGPLANDALVDFLERKDPDRPFFAFVNYMEAHEPLLPARSYRERFLSPELVEDSYRLNRSWRTGWQYTYGLRDLSLRHFEVMAGVYDAALLELDDLFRDVIERLGASGHLENTIVVLTADHGEHLGDHGLVGHRYSLYDGLLRVPLVLHAPDLIAPGHSDAPVTNMDLFTTLLALAGIEAPEAAGSLDLRTVPGDRVRLAEYPGDFPIYATKKSELPPDFDEIRWTRRLRALVDGEHKLIWASDGRHELFGLSEDPTEVIDLARREGPRLDAFLEELEALRLDLAPYVPSADGPTPEFVKQLEGIGY